MIPSREIPFFGEAPQQFWAIIAKFGCIRVSLGDPNNRIRIWQFGFFRFHSDDQPENSQRRSLCAIAFHLMTDASP
jgi:hypothetical protein